MGSPTQDRNHEIILANAVITHARLLHHRKPKNLSSRWPCWEASAQGLRESRASVLATSKKTTKTAGQYIAAAPREAQEKLREVRAAILEAAPTAKEGFSYGMPYYDYKERLAWFGLSRAHIGLYLRPPVVEAHKKELAGYVTTKSAVHLPLGKKVPAALIKKLVKARMRMNEAEE